MATRALDPARAEAFAGKMVGVLTDAFLRPMVSVGHQTELFEDAGFTDVALNKLEGDIMHVFCVARKVR